MKTIRLFRAERWYGITLQVEHIIGWDVDDPQKIESHKQTRVFTTGGMFTSAEHPTDFERRLAEVLDPQPEEMEPEELSKIVGFEQASIRLGGLIATNAESVWRKHPTSRTIFVKFDSQEAASDAMDHIISLSD